MSADDFDIVHRGSNHATYGDTNSERKGTTVTGSGMSFAQGQTLNRHQRRKLSKLNGIKIPGTERPYIKPKKNKFGHNEGTR